MKEFAKQLNLCQKFSLSVWQWSKTCSHNGAFVNLIKHTKHFTGSFTVLIKNVWNELNKQIGKYEITNKTQLKDVLKEWIKIKPDIIWKLIFSMKNRLKESKKE